MRDKLRKSNSQSKNNSQSKSTTSKVDSITSNKVSATLATERPELLEPIKFSDPKPNIPPPPTNYEEKKREYNDSHQNDSRNDSQILSSFSLTKKEKEKDNDDDDESDEEEEDEKKEEKKEEKKKKEKRKKKTNKTIESLSEHFGEIGIEMIQKIMINAKKKKEYIHHDRSQFLQQVPIQSINKFIDNDNLKEAAKFVF